MQKPIRLEHINCYYWYQNSVNISTWIAVIMSKKWERLVVISFHIILLSKANLRLQFIHPNCHCLSCIDGIALVITQCIELLLQLQNCSSIIVEQVSHLTSQHQWNLNNVELLNFVLPSHTLQWHCSKLCLCLVCHPRPQQRRSQPDSPGHMFILNSIPLCILTFFF